MENKKLLAYRQGEVLFFPQQFEKPENSTYIADSISAYKNLHDPIIASGASGNTHKVIHDDNAICVDMKQIWSDRMFTILGSLSRYAKVLYTKIGVIVVHPEHVNLDLPPGIYFIRTQREFSEFGPTGVLD